MAASISEVPQSPEPEDATANSKNGSNYK